MDFNHKLDKILEDIQEIENYTVDFKNARAIPKIEMDILTEKVRHLYDELLQIDRNYPYEAPATQSEGISFDYQSEDQPEKQVKQKQEPAKKKHPSSGEPAENEKRAQEETRKEKEKEKEEEPNKETSQKQEKEEKKTTFPEENASSRIQYEDQSVEESKTVNRPENEDIPEILADRFYNTKTSMHDSLARKQSQNNISSKIQAKPIQDLNKAIGLNERFLFIRELFGGDKNAYYEAIQIINEMPNYEEAEQYIQERFNWDEDKPEVIRFMELVRRRFVS
ncbi:MAG: hypothetical protein V5A47_02405 [Bacteroidales bacterium]|nr:hypothetical protein [Bacteroidales bacterium]MBS3775629.1 hypothetical protein [Bacteroidales bacterium]